MIDVERSEQQQQESRKAIFFKIFVLNFFLSLFVFHRHNFSRSSPKPYTFRFTHCNGFVSLNLDDCHQLWCWESNFIIFPCLIFFESYIAVNVYNLNPAIGAADVKITCLSSSLEMESERGKINQSRWGRGGSYTSSQDGSSQLSNQITIGAVWSKTMGKGWKGNKIP